MQLTDLHLGESRERDFVTMQTICALLGHESDTDLVVISGDLFSSDMIGQDLTTDQLHESKGKHLDFHQRQILSGLWRGLQQLFIERDIPFVVSMGNHDDGIYWTREEIIREYAGAPQLPSLKRHVSAPQHYSLSIFPKGINETPALQVFLLHSASNQCVMRGKEMSPAERLAFGCMENTSALAGFVGKEMHQWEKDKSSNPPPAVLVFSHFPLLQHLQMARDTLSDNDSRSVSQGVGKNTTDMRGNIHDGVSCGLLFKGYKGGETLFSLLQRHSSRIAALFSGHNHNNDFVGVHDGVVVGFGRKSGAGSYGAHTRGARMIEIMHLGQGEELSDDPRMFIRRMGPMAIRTYIREENGNIPSDIKPSVSGDVRKKLEKMPPVITQDVCG